MDKVSVSQRMSQAQYSVEDPTSSPFGTWPGKLKLKQDLENEESEDEQTEQAREDCQLYEPSNQISPKESYRSEDRRQ